MQPLKPHQWRLWLFKHDRRWSSVSGGHPGMRLAAAMILLKLWSEEVSKHQRKIYYSDESKHTLYQTCRRNTLESLIFNCDLRTHFTFKHGSALTHEAPRVLRYATEYKNRLLRLNNQWIRKWSNKYKFLAHCLAFLEWRRCLQNRDVQQSFVSCEYTS